MDEITAAQAATLTGLSERTIRRKIASGALPARRLATNRYAIKVSDLPMSHPFATLASRVEAIEHRLDAMEAYGRQFLERWESRGVGTSSEAASSLLPGMAPISNREVQQFLAHLAYETARLVRSMPYPPSPESALSERMMTPEDGEQATSGGALPERAGT